MGNVILGQPCRKVSKMSHQHGPMVQCYTPHPDLWIGQSAATKARKAYKKPLQRTPVCHKGSSNKFYTGTAKRLDSGSLDNIAPLATTDPCILTEFAASSFPELLSCQSSLHILQTKSEICAQP